MPNGMHDCGNIGEIDEPCQRCTTGHAYRTIGTVAMCTPCANKLLDPIRKRIGRQLPLRFAEAIGNGFVRCQWCGASWLGLVDDDCDWCVRRHARMDDDERKELLWPSWASNGMDGPRYEALDDASKEVWRQTRGQRVDTDTIDKWLTQLDMAVRRKLITVHQADDAIKRVIKT